MSAPTTGAFNLATAPTIPLEGELVRMVAFAPLTRRIPPDFLYASGKPNRFNPAGLECVYFATDEQTALAEYERAFAGLPGVRQPRTTYFARVRLARVLDLTSPPTLAHLGLGLADLTAEWRSASHPTQTQQLGTAVASAPAIAGSVTPRSPRVRRSSAERTWSSSEPASRPATGWRSSDQEASRSRPGRDEEAGCGRERS